MRALGCVAFGAGLADEFRALSGAVLLISFFAFVLIVYR
jgi:hypothetical protein